MGNSCTVCDSFFFLSQWLQLTDTFIAPAQDAISYQAVKFRDGFKDDVSIYQGDPSPDVDQAWVDLYDSTNNPNRL